MVLLAFSLFHPSGMLTASIFSCSCKRRVILSTAILNTERRLADHSSTLADPISEGTCLSEVLFHHTSQMDDDDKKY